MVRTPERSASPRNVCLSLLSGPPLAPLDDWTASSAVTRSRQPASRADPASPGLTSGGPSGLHTGTPGLHTGTPGLHVGTPELHVGTLELHVGTPGLHVGTLELHVGTLGLHVGTSGLHVGTSGLHVGTSDVHVEASGLHVGTSGLHVGTSGLHVGASGVHVETFGVHAARGGLGRLRAAGTIWPRSDRRFGLRETRLFGRWLNRLPHQRVARLAAGRRPAVGSRGGQSDRSACPAGEAAAAAAARGGRTQQVRRKPADRVRDPDQGFTTEGQGLGYWVRRNAKFSRMRAWAQRLEQPEQISIFRRNQPITPVARRL
jgi:hypothetical protein